MRIFDFLAIMNPNIHPAETKVHLATQGSGEHPLDLYRIGQFEEFQRWQTSERNFERKFVLALIEQPAQDSWLFAGVYHSNGVKSKEWREIRQSDYYRYELTED